MELWQRYYTPHTIDEALAVLDEYDGRARIVAGGTDLLVEMRVGQHAPYPALVDVTAIPDLVGITHDGDQIVIGAGVTHSQIERSPILQRYATCLIESCGVVGGPQVRNVATLGGNVAHALPAGDGTVSLVALAAEAEIIQGGARRWEPIEALYLGPGKSLLDPSRDLLIRFRLRASSERDGSAFSRIMRPQGVALPVLGCAVWVRLDAAGERCTDARVCIAPIGPTPARAEAVERVLIGSAANDDTIQAAVQAALASLHPRTSKYRATAAYRQEMIGVLLTRTLRAAAERARG
jgi:carbon-monoxide dehydrogenase medium subunit